MATFPNGAVRITGYLGLSDSTDTYATHVDILGWGGKMSVDTVSDRNAIPTERRKFGMIVTVTADPTPANNKSYQLQNTALGGSNNTITDNANWVEFLSGFTLSNGSGTTANGSGVDLGGTLSSTANFDGSTNTYSFNLIDFDEVKVVNSTLFSVEATTVRLIGLTEDVTAKVLYYDEATGTVTMGDSIVAATPLATYFQGDGSTTEFTLAVVSDVQIHFVDLGGVIQENGVNVTIDNALKKVTFTTAPEATQRIGVYYYTDLVVGGGGSFTLTNGNGTSANGTAVDLGGTATVDITIDMGINSFIVTNAGSIWLNADGGDLDLYGGGGISIIGYSGIALNTQNGGPINITTGGNDLIQVAPHEFTLSSTAGSLYGGDTLFTIDASLVTSDITTYGKFTINNADFEIIDGLGAVTINIGTDVAPILSTDFYSSGHFYLQAGTAILDINQAGGNNVGIYGEYLGLYSNGEVEIAAADHTLYLQGGGYVNFSGALDFNLPAPTITLGTALTETTLTIHELPIGYTGFYLNYDDITDTITYWPTPYPHDFTGDAGKILQINATEDGFDLINLPSGGFDNNGSTNAIVKSDGTDIVDTGWTSAATGILTGTNAATPPTVAADTASMYVNDIVAGNAAFHFKSEAGDIIKLYEVATYTISNWSTLRTLDASSGTITIDDVLDLLLTFIDDIKGTGLFA